jgi:predicted  nucleic acid-binding Zn-ribbon protein
MTDEELRALVVSNAQAIANNTRSIEQLNHSIEQLNQKTASLDRQLSLLTQQVQTMANSQISSDLRMVQAERNIQGIYDILQAYAREQDARSQLINQQIQALIDERRRV